MMANEVELICNKIGCTLAQTGKCVLNREPISCQDRIDSLSSNDGAADFMAPLEPPVEKFAQFTNSYTLNVTQAEDLMTSRYCRVVGVLGAPGTGKTACLVSFYLMMAHNRLSEFDFRDSKTIKAFEEICQGARSWNEAGLPQDLTLHTELPDERTAGFLHLRLRNKDNQACYDLLIPDLPGEWTNTLISETRTDRLNFLKSAEVIWLLVNGKELQDAGLRHTVLHKLTLLIQRLSVMMGEKRPPLVLVVTHKDLYKVNEGSLKKVFDCAATNGFTISFAEIASFSDKEDVPAGDGIESLISGLLKNEDAIPDQFWTTMGQEPVKRQFMNFGKE